MTSAPRYALALAGLALAWLSAAPASAQSASTLTLADAVNEALVKNDRIVNQSDTTAQADLSVRLARSAFHPKVTPNVFGSFGRTDISSQTYRVDVSEKLTTGTEVRLSVGTASQLIPGAFPERSPDVLFYSADTTLTVSQPLLRGLGRSVARHFPQAKVVLTTTAGELCSAGEQTPLYLPANGQWQSMVFQLFDAALVSDVHVAAVPQSERLRPSDGAIAAFGTT